MKVFLQIILHCVLILALSPLLLGIINRVKALAAGRKGPPLLQVWFDLLKLFRKQMVISRTATWIFVAGPIISVAASVIAALFVPLGFKPAPCSFPGDIILFVYLFALSRFFVAAAALDTGSSFEGMGAAREVSMASFAEPAAFLVFIVLVAMTGEFSLSSLLLASPAPGAWQMPVLALIALSWFVVLLAENCRIPFDDPNTHLELTMIHEVMVLDHSGPALALIETGAAVRLFLGCSIFVSMIFPKLVPSSLLGWPLFIAGMFASAVLIGLIESSMARLRLQTIPKLLVGACLLSAFGVLLIMR